jgi:hypothetical protein
MIEKFSNSSIPPQHPKKVGAVGGVMPTTVGPLRGTEGSKPLLSSGEFRANLTWVIGGPGSDFNASGPPDALLRLYPAG